MTARCREDLASDARIKNFTDKIDQNQKAFEKPKGDQPKTLVELGGRAVSASRQGLRNARSRLGGSSQEVDQSLPEEPLSLDQSPHLSRPRAPERKPRREPSKPSPASQQRGRRFRAQELPLRLIPLPQVQRARRLTATLCR